jgi:hypothetical protein
MNIYQCNVCTKSFNTQDALNGHKRVHGTSKGQIYRPRCCHITSKREIDASSLYRYDSSLRVCANCGLRNTKSRFCSHMCSATYNNKLRQHSEVSKAKTSSSLISYFAEHPKSKKILVQVCNSESNIVEPIIVGPFSKIHTRTCAHCNTKFVNRRAIKYCYLHRDLYKSNNRNRYRFTFSISKYPDLFGDYSELLRNYGMWSPTNTNGLTRDHRVSVNEAIKNNYDPYYITHPLNCELLPWQENNLKNTDSSISYEELVKLVNEYDNRY